VLVISATSFALHQLAPEDYVEYPYPPELEQLQEDLEEKFPFLVFHLTMKELVVIHKRRGFLCGFQAGCTLEQAQQTIEREIL